MEPLEIVQLLGDLGEFLGALAVFATLLYLAIQVRDASRAAKFAAVEANRAQRIASFTGIRDSPYLPPILVKIQTGEKLNAEEKIRLMSHDSSMWALLYAEWVQRDLGLMEEFATIDELSMGIALSSPSAMDWWRVAGEHVYPARFVQYVNKMAATHEAAGSVLPDELHALLDS
jgi:hypothetical protein